MPTQVPKRPIDHKGQIYIPVGTEAYDTQDGREVSLILFRTRCPICSAPFVTKLTMARLARRQFTRRCPVHRLPGFTVEAQLARIRRQEAQQHATAVAHMLD